MPVVVDLTPEEKVVVANEVHSSLTNAEFALAKIGLFKLEYFPDEATKEKILAASRALGEAKKACFDVCMKLEGAC